MPNETSPENPAAQRRRRGRPVGDRDAKVGQLLEAAREVIAREGCAGASLRKVAEHAGHSTGAITYYFADRDDLLAKLVENLFGDFDRWLEAAHDGSPDLRTVLERALLPRGTRNERGRIARLVWLQLLVHAGTDAKLAAVIERFYGQFRDRLAALIARGQADGTVRRDFPADLLADQVCALADGLVMARPVERKRFDDRRMRSLVEMAIAMLEPSEPAEHAGDQPALAPRGRS
jgi:AcrR family transcriptional regulator